MLLNGERIRALRELKGIWSQQHLADRVGVSQSHVHDLEKGKLRNQSVFLKLADALDCTTDFLFARGPFKSINLHDGPTLHDAASRMAFDVFVSEINVSDEWRERCRRVLGHEVAPVSADAWRHLAEQIDLAVGPSFGGNLKLVR